MKYAIMSDAHANPLALKTALADARSLGCEKFIFAGDITGYGYDAKTTLNLVRENFDVVLLGNHDSACAGLEPAWEVQMISSTKTYVHLISSGKYPLGNSVST